MAAAGNCGQNAAVQVPSHISTLGSKGSCSPSHMEEPVETDWLREIVVKGYDDGNLQIKLEYEDDYCYVSFVELSDMATGERCLELSHLAIWCTYLHRLCAERTLSDLYGFICPYKITLEGRSSSIVSANIRNRMVNNKKVYLAPFCNEGHWQLIVLVPEQNYVVWMCSLSKKPTKKIKEMINNAMDSRVDTRWLFPKVARQQNKYHCGYFVMKYMITIVNASITDSWEEVFDNTKAYTYEEILEVRRRWAEFYMKIRPVGSH